jgi:hypothetical protein
MQGFCCCKWPFPSLEVQVKLLVKQMLASFKGVAETLASKIIGPGTVIMYVGQIK